MQSVDVMGFTLPCQYYSLVKAFELGTCCSVAGNIAAEFPFPGIKSGLGYRRATAAFVSMPKTPVDEHGALEPWQPHVWSTGQPSVVRVISKVGGVLLPPNRPFIRCVLSSNSRHLDASPQALLFLIVHSVVAPSPLTAASAGRTNSQVVSFKKHGYFP